MKTIEIFERINELLKENGLCDNFFETAREYLDSAEKLFHTTPVQTTIFAVFLEHYGDYQVRIDDITESLKCSRFQFINYMDDLEELKKKKLIRETKDSWAYSRDNVQFTIPLDVINSIRKSIEFNGKSNENLEPIDFYDYADDLFSATKNNEIDSEALYDEVKYLFEYNRNINFVKKLNEYNLNETSKVILLNLCCALVSNNEDKVGTNDLSLVFDHRIFRNFIRSFKNQEHELFTKGLVNFDNQKGLFDTEYFLLSNKAKEEFLSDVTLFENKNNNKHLIPVSKLSEKKLYYNEKTNNRISELTSLLLDDNFKSVQKRLSENGMRTGFACVFSGPPGTGKTETVYQIAHKTGRDIMLVDISATKSCWFGESEKLIKDVFDQYRTIVENGGITPILLFNEADAVLGKRREISKTSGGVAQTENAIQNIILQEMEDIKGILIATTNMTDNFDKAFERRFLYKIEFDKPDFESKKLIWKSNIKDLSDEDATKLAEQYDFSGGQIENIARKTVISSILNGLPPRLPELMSFCNEEKIIKQEKVIGF